jgi:hypothetical protein
MKEIYLCWLDDIKGFIESLESICEDVELQHNVKFIIDPHQDSNNFGIIARNIDSDLIFLIDYNLEGYIGNTANGDSVIQDIRKYNTDCKIVFYSSNATQSELRKLVNGLPNIICEARENLPDVLVRIANGSL